MKDDHFGNVADSKAGSSRTHAPLNVLRNFDSGKWTNFSEIRATHGQVTGTRESIFLDVQLESIREDRFIGFESGKCRFVVAPDLNITAKYRSFILGCIDH